MFNRKETCVVTTVLFLGVILSCAIFFGVSYILDASILDESIDHQSFDRSFYENEDVNRIVTFLDYRLFGTLKTKNVIVGKNNFLFEVERDGYNFINDFMGNLSFSENELDVIHKNLNLRKSVYDQMNVEYLIVVIPNSQTVYDSNMPTYVGEKSKSTRLEQLEAYLKENTDINFIDLTSLLQRIKGSYPVYNNTANTINSLGAFYLYKEVFRSLPQNITKDSILIENYIDKISLHNTEGKELAKLSGVESFVKNRTLSIQTSVPRMYSVLDLNELIQATYIKSEYYDVVTSDTSIMIEYANEWDKLQVAPYFSNTFETVIYKRNYNFGSREIKNNNVSAVIQIVRECDLDSFLDSNVTLSYNAGINELGSPEITSAPLMLGKVDVDANTVCIAGRVEESSVLTVRSLGEESKSIAPYGERFLIAMDFDDLTEKKIELFAVAAGKETSESLEITASPNPSAKPTGIIVGNNSNLFSAELVNRYSENKLYNSLELSVITKKMLSDKAKVTNICNKKTEVIYLVVPSKINVYSPDLNGYQQSKINKVKQLTNVAENLSGISVIDLSKTMVDNKHIGRLYNQMSSDWTALGAYLGYSTLINKISERYPLVNPNELEKYKINRTYVDGGVYVSALGLDPISFSELVPELIPIFESVVDKTVGDDGSVLYRSKANDHTLPTAVVVCDTYGKDIVPLMAEHFLSLYVLPTHQKKISEKVLSELSPDYIINVFCEDNLDYFIK